MGRYHFEMEFEEYEGNNYFCGDCESDLNKPADKKAALRSYEIEFFQTEKKEDGNEKKIMASCLSNSSYESNYSSTVDAGYLDTSPDSQCCQESEKENKKT